MEVMVRILVFAATAVAVSVGSIAVGVEIGLRNGGQMSEDAQGKIVQMAIASACPELPETMAIATSQAYRYSWRNPIDLPPWRVLQAAHLLKSKAPPDQNPVASALCANILTEDSAKR